MSDIQRSHALVAIGPPARKAFTDLYAKALDFDLFKKTESDQAAAYGVEMVNFAMGNAYAARRYGRAAFARPVVEPITTILAANDEIIPTMQATSVSSAVSSSVSFHTLLDKPSKAVGTLEGLGAYTIFSGTFPSQPMTLWNASESWGAVEIADFHIDTSIQTDTAVWNTFISAPIGSIRFPNWHFLKPNDERQISNLISYVKLFLEVPYQIKLAARLKYLLDIAADEGIPLDIFAKALGHFVSFLTTNNSVGYPQVGLANDGTIGVEWRTDPFHHFSVQFLEDGFTRFLIRVRDARRTDKTAQFSGNVSSEALMHSAAALGVMDWISL